jgi:hypothetical protein
LKPGPGLAQLVIGIACATLCAQVPPPAGTPTGSYSGLPKLFQELGTPAYDFEFIPGPTTRITFEAEDPWGVQGDRSLRVWVAALGLAHLDRTHPSHVTPHLRLLPRGGTALDLVWESTGTSSQLKRTRWSALLGPKSIPEAWWDALAEFRAQWPSQLASLPSPALARLLHVQASGWSAPYLEAFSRPPQLVPSPCWPVRAIRAEIPESERGQRKGSNPLITWNREGIPGGITSDFAPNYVGGTPKGLRIEVQLIKGSNSTHGWCVNAPRIFTLQLPFPSRTKVLPYHVVEGWAETLQRKALGTPPENPLVDRAPIQLKPGIVLHIGQPQISDGTADLKDSVDRLIRYTACVNQLFLGEVPAEALHEGSLHQPAFGAGELNTSLCSWKGGYGMDFGPEAGWNFKGQLRFTVITPDPEAYRHSISEALERAGLTSTIKVLGQEQHPLADFLVPGHPRFSQFR